MDVAYSSIAKFDPVTKQVTKLMTEDAREFHAPQTITPEGLADDLAVLVWENFTDFVSGWEGDSTLDELKLVDADGKADEHAVEEALIFLLWAHTRGAQQAFSGGPSPRPSRGRSMLSMKRSSGTWWKTERPGHSYRSSSSEPARVMPNTTRLPRSPMRVSGKR